MTGTAPAGLGRTNAGVLFADMGPPEAWLDLARFADEAGVRRAWLTETNGPDPLVLAGAIGCMTRLEVGTAITMTAARTPVAIASAAATLSRLTDRPVHLGIGVGGEAIATRWHGSDYGSPVERVGDAVTIVRQVLEGDRTDYDGRHYQSHGFRLTSPPRSRVRCLIGGMGPRMARAAGRLADGLILSWSTEEFVAARRRLLDDASDAERAAPSQLLVRAYVAVVDDPRPVREAVRSELLTYLASPPYGRAFTEMGFGDLVDRATTGADRSDVARSLPDEVIDRLLIAGDRDHCLQRLNRLRSAGADELLVQPVADWRRGDEQRTISALWS